MLAQTRQVGGGLRLAVEEVVEQRERHLLWSATVRVNVEQVAAKKEQNLCKCEQLNVEQMFLPRAYVISS